jgi:hypothetical protein
LLPSLLPSDGSAQVRLLALFQEVLEPESLGVVHRQLLDFFGRHEPEFGGLVGDCQLAAGDAGGEADVELAADLAVGVGDDVFGSV